MIDSLLKPSKYSDKPDKVTLVQTHISMVFISKKYVYKIKKPVDFGFLDFTTLEKRKFYCNREIELNSRLSPEIYIKVVPVVKKGKEYFYDKDGEIVDYAVVMKRIDENYLLKNLLEKNGVKVDDFKTVADTLVMFHKNYPATLEMAKKNATIDALKFTTDENFLQTEKYIGISIDKNLYEDLKVFTDDFYKFQKVLLNRRIKSCKIKECHGDLHLEHVGIYDNRPFFIDCIEFNDRFRIIDVANEVAFLSMDLDFNGYRKFGKAFADYYIELSNDDEMHDLIDFYKVYRAYVRGKVTSFLIDDPNVPEQEKHSIIEKAKKYFKLAHSYIIS